MPALAPASGYQLMKIMVLRLVPLGKDAIHIYIGVFCLLVAVVPLRIPPVSYRALVPGLIVSSFMELLDLRDSYRTRGRLLWAASLKDFANTNLIPLVIIWLARRQRSRAQRAEELRRR